jgi:diacylglycerol kinase
MTNDRTKQTLAKAFLSAFRGIGHAAQQRSFLIQLSIGILAIILSFVFIMSRIERIIIVMLVALVLGAEMFNSALEYLLDVISRNHDPMIATVKELMAGVVLVFSLAALIVGFWIFSHALFPR